MNILELCTIMFIGLTIIPILYFINMQFKCNFLNGDTKFVRIGTTALGIALLISLLLNIYVTYLVHDISTTFIKHLRFMSSVFFSIGVWYFVVLWLWLTRKQ